MLSKVIILLNEDLKILITLRKIFFLRRYLTLKDGVHSLFYFCINNYQTNTFGVMLLSG